MRVFSVERAYCIKRASQRARPQGWRPRPTTVWPLLRNMMRPQFSQTLGREKSGPPPWAARARLQTRAVCLPSSDSAAMGDDMTKPIACGSCCCLVLIASSIMLGCSFGVLDPTQFALDYDTVSCGRTPAPCSTSATLTAAPAPNLAPPPSPITLAVAPPMSRSTFRSTTRCCTRAGGTSSGWGTCSSSFRTRCRRCAWAPSRRARRWTARRSPPAACSHALRMGCRRESSPDPLRGD